MTQPPLSMDHHNMARLEFASDYMEGCIPEILAKLGETNL